MPTRGKLGRLSPRQDTRTLRLRDYLPTAVPTPPTSKSYDHGIKSWGMMGNDRIGDCTCAAVGHAVQETTANTATEVTIPDSAIIAAYSAVSGYNPVTGQNDNGAVEMDVLKYWQQTGVGGHKNSAYAACSVSGLDDVRAAIDLFGFCYIGFTVPLYAMQQFDAGQPWDVDPSGDQTIDGGHAVILVDYDQTGFTAITWGALQRMTNAFFSTYVDEAWGVVLPEWIAANGQAPSGFNLTQLLADVQQLQQPPTPTPTPVLISTTTTLSLSAQSVVVGQSVTGSVTVNAADGSTPAGTVQLSVNGQATGAVGTLTHGVTTFTLTPTLAGTYSVAANYTRSGNYAGGQSAAVTLVVNAPTPTPTDPDRPLEDWLVAEAAYLQAQRSEALDRQQFTVIETTLKQWEPNTCIRIEARA